MKRILWLPVAAVLLGGCVSPVHTRELEQLLPVRTLGFDGTVGAVTVSVSSGADPSGEPPTRLFAEGQSITDAIQMLQEASAREELFFAHVGFAALGETAAREGIAPLLDWFGRSTQTTLTVPLFVVRGAEAKTLVAAGDDRQEVTALLSSLLREGEQRGAPRCFTLLETARSLERSGTALCAAVELVPARDSAPDADEDALQVRSAGYAVWKNGRVVGFLDGDEALGADLLRGDTGRAAVVLPLGANARASAELRRCRVSTAPGGRIRLDCRAGLVEAEGVGPLDDSALRAMNRALAGALLRRAAAALRAAQALDADVAGLCGRLGIDPADFAALDWRVEVTASIERSFDINGSAETAHGR